VHFAPGFDSIGEAGSRVVFPQAFFDENYANVANFANDL
jgi:hypothetical protein